MFLKCHVLARTLDLYVRAETLEQKAVVPQAGSWRTSSAPLGIRHWRRTHVPFGLASFGLASQATNCRCGCRDRCGSLLPLQLGIAPTSSRSISFTGRDPLLARVRTARGNQTVLWGSEYWVPRWQITKIKELILTLCLHCPVKGLFLLTNRWSQEPV